jgi:teichuronic acid biosynthesis glycosyltransferase TuaC
VKVLHIAGGLPSKERPFQQPFIRSQIDSLLNQGVRIEIVEIRGYESSINYFKAIGEIKKIVKTKGIHLIHAHYSYCGLVALLANTKVPLILSLMGNDILGTPNFKGKLTFRGKMDIILSKIIIKKVNHVIVKSEKMNSQIKSNIPYSVVPNGVNFELFKPQNLIESRRKLGIDENDFAILFLGDKNVTVKNFQLTNNAVEKFKKNINVKNINLISPFGIAPTQVVDYLNAADVLLLTSFYEGSPNVVKEAMACNLPIISTDVGDVKEIIQNTDYCFITGYSEDEIANKLNIIYNIRGRTNGRDKIQHLSSENIAKRIIEIYNRLLVK